MMINPSNNPSNNTNSNNNSIIHSVESMGALDGDGIRYCVYFRGCPLRCVYCHNPDTWYGEHKVLDSEMTPVKVKELCGKIKRYKPYFKRGGGVTFSGGEPLLHSGFINEVADEIIPAGISYALDTSGHVELTEEVCHAIERADLVILDLKFATEADYSQNCCGELNKVIAFAKHLQENKIRTWLRTVVVPGINDNKDELEKYISLVNREGLHFFERYELLAFHDMGFYKYELLGCANPLADTKPLETQKYSELCDWFSARLAQ